MAEAIVEKRIARLVLKAVCEVSKEGLPLSPSLVDLRCGNGEWLHVFGSMMGSYPDLMFGFDPEKRQHEGWLPGAKWWNRQFYHEPPTAGRIREFVGDIGPDVLLCIDPTLGDTAEGFRSATAKMLVESKARVIIFAPGVGTKPEAWFEMFKSTPYTCLDVIRPQLWDDASIPLALLESLFIIVSDAVVKPWFKENVPNLGLFDLSHPRRRKGET